MQREDILKLVKAKEDIENELKQINKELAEIPNVDIMVDDEGFPRNDIDVHAVMILKNRRAILETDFKNIMKDIEKNLFAYHAILKETHPANGKKDNNTNSKTNNVINNNIKKKNDINIDKKDGIKAVHSNKIDYSNMKGFYVIENISANSPASEAGLQINDVVVQFGSLNISNATPRGMKEVVENSVDKKLRVVVKREDKIRVLNLIPHRWSGQGLLGCQLKPL